jgi:hypothetical protein
LLREELDKVSKQLAEQKALVATLEVEITTVLQEKKIQELDYKSHVQQYVIVIHTYSSVKPLIELIFEVWVFAH